MSDETERLDDLGSEQEAEDCLKVHYETARTKAVLRFNVAGTSFRKDMLSRVYALYLQHKAAGMYVEINLQPEPDNKYDPNAIKVQVFFLPDYIFFGYVPKTEQGALTAFQHNHPNHTIRIAYMGDNHTGTGNIGCIVELKETVAKRLPPVGDENLYPTSPDDANYDLYEGHGDDFSDFGDTEIKETN